MVTRREDGRLSCVKDSFARAKKTQNGDLLLELKAKDGGNKLQEELSSVLGTSAKIRTVTDVTHLELRKLDCLAVLDQLSVDVRGKTKDGKVFVAGDFNAWSEEWGSSSTNAKGRTVLEAFATSDLVVLNTCSEFTFNRAGYGSVIDVTFTSRQIFNTAKWELCSHYTASDHTAIMCTIGDSPAAAGVTPDKPKMYRVDTLNPETFASTLCFPPMVGDANDLSRKLMAAITASCDSSMAVRRSHSRHKRSVYWWNAGIAEARNRCLRARRCYQRTRGQGNFTSLQQESADRRRLLSRLIKDSKRKCFLDLCNEAETDIWVRLQPEKFADVFSKCLKECTFPEIWKKQNLVLIPKPNKPLEDPSGYRPLCMLDVAAKILEKIISTRLEAAISQAGDLSTMQFGFRKAKSTLDALSTVVDIAEKAIGGQRWKGGGKKYCLISTLDVKNAFNTANWTKIIDALGRFQVPENLIFTIEDYFRNRVLNYDTRNGVLSYEIRGGVPQGSVLGPLLWNAMYDGILRINLPTECHIVGFADDVALVVVAKHLREAEEKTVVSRGAAKQWLSDAGLTLADHKTEAVLVSSRKTVEVAKIELETCVMAKSPLSLRSSLVVMAVIGHICTVLDTKPVMNAHGAKKMWRNHRNTSYSSAQGSRKSDGIWRFNNERQRVADLINTALTPDNLVTAMLAESAIWDAVCGFAGVVCQVLRQEERARNG
ncbi:uncharacterized protein [Drosophila tropicalis]|uniref:uncharacterized protein n=1 Tax=Drosophila tropicalis TaxID=46794 RepID=UPI0035ABABDE